jgi:hypothetical protein
MVSIRVRGVTSNKMALSTRANIAHENMDRKMGPLTLVPKGRDSWIEKKLRRLLTEEQKNHSHGLQIDLFSFNLDRWGKDSFRSARLCLKSSRTVLGNQSVP